MSGDDDAAAAVDDEKLHCASCGITQVDDIKLKDCDSCDLVRYCGDACQELHLPEHKEECKKRAAELRDKLLFKQPESTYLGDCPICTIPLPLDDRKYVLRPCCCNFICEGCMHRSVQLAAGERSGFPKCPYCREPAPPASDINRVFMKYIRKRVKANDPTAMSLMGGNRCSKGDYNGAFELFRKAAELGHADAHYKLAELYCEGKGVEMDSRKEIHHLEEAAIAGHPKARHDLGIYAFTNDKRERAVKHWIIAANQGQDESIQCLKKTFELEGIEGGRRSVSKEDFAAALRGHHAAVKATKSPEREAAAAFHQRIRH